MVGDWQTVPFEQLLAEPVRNGVYKPKAFHGRGAKIVNMGELFAHPRLRAVPMKRVELSDSESERFTLSKGDLLFARSNKFRDFAIQSMTGSSGRQRVPAESLSHFLVVSPTKHVAELFGKLIEPLFARASAATEEGRTLATLRDTLLPRLLSGQLRPKVT